MSATGVTNTSSTSATDSAASTSSKPKQATLGQDAFLKLLITEMQNQDPLSPMDNKDSIAQLAQFSSLEQMTQVNKNFTSFGDTFSKNSTATQAFSLTGNWIEYADSSGKTMTGKVDSVTFENGVPKLKVGTNVVDLSAVQKAYPGYSAMGAERASAQAVSMIGKTVDYFDPSNPDTLQTGAVSNVALVNGWPKVTINGKSLDFANITGIHSTSGNTDAAAMADALVGKYVDYVSPTDSTKTIRGQVKSVDSSATTPRILVGSQIVELNNVVKVYGSSA